MSLLGGAFTYLAPPDAPEAEGEGSEADESVALSDEVAPEVPDEAESDSAAALRD